MVLLCLALQLLPHSPGETNGLLKIKWGLSESFGCFGFQLKLALTQRKWIGSNTGCPKKGQAPELVALDSGFWTLSSTLCGFLAQCGSQQSEATRPHTSTQWHPEKGTRFPEFCPKYEKTFARSSRHACWRVSQARTGVEGCPWDHLHG